MILYSYGLDPGEHGAVAKVQANRPEVRGKHGIRTFPVLWVCPYSNSLPPTGAIVRSYECLLIIEGQSIRKGIRKQNILKLAFRAGVQTHGCWVRFDRPPVAQLPVPIWKDEVCPGAANIPKEVFCNRIYLALLPHEQKMVDDLGPALRMDALDSIGLAWAGITVNLKKYLLGKKDGFV